MSSIQQKGWGKQNWLDIPEDQDKDQSAGLPDFKDVTLLRFKDVLESPEQFEGFKARVKHILCGAGLSKLIDKTTHEPKKGASGAQNWLALSKMVASWIRANVSQKILKKCKKTGKRMLLATEIWDALESVIGTGSFAFMKLLKEFNGMEPEDFPEPSIYAMKVLASYSRLSTMFKNFMAPFAVLINMLVRIDIGHITVLVLTGLESRDKIYDDFTYDDLFREVHDIVTYTAVLLESPVIDPQD
ncbi:hypothetical protein N7466_010557 [Penicillium verhagenii]|uniref:uncharacterized protein n=1 Tax=Penicillium verhagenii TaxID=1562060 RepID=UPI0025455F65|nr:uncharacterized protein N7466_010557 [Penicillium verhagenii]KAJ5918565.1 hypothetical protein N7466_010557 [Penicillium verhagenii]